MVQNEIYQTMQNNRIRLVRLSEEHTIAFKEEMQEAFQHGFEAYNKDGEETNQWQVLSCKITKYIL